ncbi:MAG TPA: hypothetical protein VIU86_18865 [Gaiellaceae bacterium]
MKERELRLGQNEAVYREVNERVLGINERFGIDDDRVSFICECGQLACTERIELTVEEYEAVRSNPVHFALVPGHDDPSVERVVEQNERFAVVEKLPGGPAELAAAEDPR